MCGLRLACPAPEPRKPRPRLSRVNCTTPRLKSPSAKCFNSQGDCDTTMTSQFEARFRVGQTVHHLLFDYRGVIVDVDPVFQGTEQWYQTMAKSRPPRDEPWYHVLVHNAVHQTYVAEQNLEPDGTGEPIAHPLIDEYFDRFEDGAYHPRRNVN